MFLIARVVLLFRAGSSVRGEPRRERPDPLQPLQGLHVPLHAVHGRGPPLPVQLLQLCQRR